jgi:hypothetical protein
MTTARFFQIGTRLYTSWSIDVVHWRPKSHIFLAFSLALYFVDNRDPPLYISIYIVFFFFSSSFLRHLLLLLLRRRRRRLSYFSSSFFVRTIVYPIIEHAKKQERDIYSHTYNVRHCIDVYRFAVKRFVFMNIDLDTHCSYCAFLLSTFDQGYEIDDNGYTRRYCCCCRSTRLRHRLTCCLLACNRSPTRVFISMNRREETNWWIINNLRLIYRLIHWCRWQ